ncbi:spore coat associated protein CotJA [Paenibacillus thailandensis]|uniref:Spore coat associated protein CotJA n=1 Tax=Paenibacillus thailandensis TaxID=393250 RepID=A0ABW5QRG6_9BACL
MNQYKYDDSQLRFWKPIIGPFDPCPPIKVKSYVVPPNQYMDFQPPDLPQFSLPEALKLGTLWPALYSPYQSKFGMGVPRDE